MAELIQGYLREPGRTAVQAGERPGRPGRSDDAQGGREQRVFLMLIAGHDSTVNTIAHCVLTLLRNPESLDCCASGPN